MTARQAARKAEGPSARDRFEEADAAFFERVAQGYRAIAAAEPQRIKLLNAGGTVEAVADEIWTAGGEVDLGFTRGEVCVIIRTKTVE